MVFFFSIVPQGWLTKPTHCGLLQHCSMQVFFLAMLWCTLMCPGHPARSLGDPSKFKFLYFLKCPQLALKYLFVPAAFITAGSGGPE